MTKTTKLAKNTAGFTIVELLIVIIAVGVLLAITISSFNDYQRKRRNSERQNDIRAIQQTIESYYAQTEKYPSLNEINDSAFRGKNLKGLADEMLTDPQSKQAILVAKPAAKVYAYQPVGEDGGKCDNKARDCLTYVLTATQEGAEEFSKNNYN